MPTRHAAAAIGLILAVQGGLEARAQGATTSAPAQAAATGSCTITSRGNQQKTCMNRVPQASCAANAREQRTTFEWNAGAECP
jgi:hypothetical protein